MTKRYFYLSVLTMALFAVVSFAYVKQASAMGEDILKLQMNDLADYSGELEEPKFIENSDLYSEEPQGDKHLAYTVRLPKEWVKYSDRFAYRNKGSEQAQLKRRILGKVAEYHGPQRILGTSRFEVYAEDLQFEVTAENWLVELLLRQGYSLQGVKSYDRNKVEAEYVVFLKDTPYVVRTIAEITGRRIIVATYFCPDAYWKYERPYQQYAIESFTLTNPERVKIVATKRYAFLDILEFIYPSSWKLVAPNIYSIDGMEAKLIHTLDDKTLEGEIGINVFSTRLDTNLGKELEYVQEGLDFLKLKPTDLIETREEYTFGDHILFNKVEVYKAEHVQGAVQDHEYWIGILKEPRYYYIITLISPSRNMEYYSWARNAEAFKTILESIGPFDPHSGVTVGDEPPPVEPVERDDKDNRNKRKRTKDVGTFGN
ncbi:MAG TPA: hypothetical protein EYQ41_11505 [Micavibrio sp.]|nr:hypothetical protein [Micavibrio sp.]